MGREEELEQLHSSLASVKKGNGKTVFISGEAGSGKTRLTTEFLKSAKEKGVATLTGWCLSNAAVPYFPFFEAFNAFFTAENSEGTEAGAALTGWLKGPEASGKLQTFSPQVWKDQTFAAVAKTLTTISATKPIILFIDDIHWADSASLSLIHYIARIIASERVLLLATFRSEQLTTDADGRPSPLAETLRLMRREDLFTEIKLANLSQTNISLLVESMLQGELQQDLAKKLTEESQGNALFLVESIRMLNERNGLVQENHKWRLASDEIGIPEKIKDIIFQRLCVLSHNQRRILDAASVIGEKFDAEFLATVLGQDCLDVVDTLDVIGQVTSLVSSEGDIYCFDHARSRDAVYERLSTPLKRGYHLRAAEKLEGSRKNDKLPFSELVYHYSQAGNNEKAVKYALSAGADELERWSNAQATKHFQYVLQNIPDGNSRERRTALEGLGDAYAASYMYKEAIKTFDELASLESDVIRLRALRKATDAAFHKGDEPDILFEYAKRAEELASFNRLEMARILNNRGRAFFWARRGSIRDEIADYHAALKIFEEENSIVDVANALSRSGCVSTLIDDLRERGLGELIRSVAIFRELNDTRNEIWASLSFALGLRLSGLYSEAELGFTKVIEMGEKMDVFDELAQASTWLSEVTEHSNLEKAIQQNLRGLEYCKKTDAFWIACHTWAILARQYTKLGDLKRAGEYIDKLQNLPTEVLNSAMVGMLVGGVKTMYLSAKTSQWEKYNTSNRRIFEIAPDMAVGNKIMIMDGFAWGLEKQGLVAEAAFQRDQVQELIKQVAKRFGRANVQLIVMVPRKVTLEENFEMRLDFVNVGRRLGTLVKVVGAIPFGFTVTNLPPFCSLRDGSLCMQDRSLGGFQIETVKLNLKATRAGSQDINPEVTYVDDLGEVKTFKANPIAIAASAPKPAYEHLPGRIVTGYAELDRLLQGGIPEKYAVLLAAPSCEEKEILVNHFLKTGVEADEPTFYVAAEVGGGKALAEEYPSNFFLLVCNPQADAMIQKMPNVFKLNSIESLTEIDISLTKAFRVLKPHAAGPRRICLDIVSDVLLRHRAVATRRWISALLPMLKSNGFTILAVLKPQMHKQEEVQAITGLFQGEINISENETASGLQRVLHVGKLLNQKHLEDEVVLTKER